MEHSGTGNTLGVEICKVHRRFSGNLQLPPLSWRQGERDRSKPLSPNEDTEAAAARPTSLSIASLPRIDITEADPDRYGITVTINLRTGGGGGGGGGFQTGFILICCAVANY